MGGKSSRYGRRRGQKLEKKSGVGGGSYEDYTDNNDNNKNKLEEIINVQIYNCT
jgi:hypothetical protein